MIVTAIVDVVPKGQRQEKNVRKDAGKEWWIRAATYPIWRLPTGRISLKFPVLLPEMTVDVTHSSQTEILGGSKTA